MAKETAGDRTLRLLFQAAEFAEGFPCQRRNGRTCPCGPCSAKRALRHLRRNAAKAQRAAVVKRWNDSL